MAGYGQFKIVKIMRYSLVSSVTDKQIDFACKRDLVDWIRIHSVFLSEYICRYWSVYRAMKPKQYCSKYRLLSRICSLRGYIVKHKLL